MSLLRRALAAAVPTAVVLSTAAGALTASASPDPGAVYVLGNQPGGNAVLEFERAADGTLVPAGSYATGGLGTGGGLGSQGAVVLDGAGRYLFAVNPGSDDVSSFRVTADGLQLTDRVESGGSRPTSVTVHHGVVYVLNAGGAGNISGFTVDGGDLEPIEGSTRPLSGDATAPAQVSFTPDGSQLVVTERATRSIDVYDVDAAGVASGPVTSPSSGVTPFGFGFDNKGHLIVSEAFGGAAGASAVSSYRVDASGVSPISASVPTTETAACWIAVTGNGRFAYAGNAGTASITGYRVDANGALTILDEDGMTAPAAAGVFDLATSRDSQFLYGRLGNGTIGAWVIAADGSLSALPPITGLPAGAAGIAAA